MTHLNRTSLIGRVGKDPVIKQISQDRSIATLTLATSEKWKDKNTDEIKEKTEWHNIVIYPQGLVKVARDYIRKGSLIFVEGASRTRAYLDLENNKRYMFEVVLMGYNGKLVLLGNKPAPAKKLENETPETPDTPDYQLDDIDDLIPF